MHRHSFLLLSILLPVWIWATPRFSVGSDIASLWQAKFAEPGSVYMSPDGTRVLRNVFRSGHVSILDAADGSTLRELDVAGTGTTYSPDSRRVVLFDHDARQFIIVEDGQTHLRRVNYPQDVSTADMRQVGNTLRDLLRRITNDGKNLIFALPDGRVFSVDLNGGEVHIMFNWRDYLESFKFSARVSTNAGLRLDYVSLRKVVGRVNEKLFVWSVREGGQSSVVVFEGAFDRDSGQVDHVNRQVILTAVTDGARYANRFAVFNVDESVLTFGADFARQLSSRFVVSQSRARVVEVITRGVRRPSDMRISKLRNGNVVETVTGSPSQVYSVSADARGDIWLLADGENNVSVWTWRNEQPK